MKKFFKFGCLGIIAFFVLILIIGIFASVSDDKKSGKNTSKHDSETSLSEKSKADEKKIASIGDDLQINNVVFTVNEISATKEIKDAGGYISYKPESEGAEFLVVNVTVKNAGKEAITTDSSFFKLNKGDVVYSPSTIFTTDSKFFLYDGINPGLKKTGNILFEIPEASQDLTLTVQTGFWGTETGIINLK